MPGDKRKTYSFTYQGVRNQVKGECAVRPRKSDNHEYFQRSLSSNVLVVQDVPLPSWLTFLFLLCCKARKERTDSLFWSRHPLAGWGSSTRMGEGRKVRSLPQKFIHSLRNPGKTNFVAGMSREFSRISRTPGGAQKVPEKSLCSACKWIKKTHAIVTKILLVSMDLHGFWEAHFLGSSESSKIRAYKVLETSLACGNLKGLFVLNKPDDFCLHRPLFYVCSSCQRMKYIFYLHPRSRKGMVSIQNRNKGFVLLLMVGWV